jgi:hypothetical protein
VEPSVVVGSLLAEPSVVVGSLLEDPSAEESSLEESPADVDPLSAVAPVSSLESPEVVAVLDGDEV